jgi:beta-lactamase regulating signal transducer with metallopeptidase domain
VIAIFLSQFWVQRLGWTLLHFLWQGTAIVIVYAMLRSWLARSLSAKRRYILACAALAVMAIAPPLTFLLIPNLHETSTPFVSAQIALWTISPSESQRFLTSVVALWLLGVLVFSLRLFGGWRFTARLRSASHPAPAEWQQAVGKIAARMGGVLSGAMRPGAQRSVVLRVSSMVDVPTVIGWLRPVILMPVEFFAGLPAGHITALLAHEMAHIRRRDYLASLLQSVAEAVLFYHPAVWWISEQIRAERELCCDDLAVVASGDVLIYAQALAALEARRPSRLRPVLAANGGSLVNRIRRLIEPSHAVANNLPGPGAAWAMTVLWLAGVGVATVHAAQKPLPPVANLNVVNLNLLPAPAPSRAVPALHGRVTVATITRHTRNTLLYDPLLSAQLAQPPQQAVTPAPAPDVRFKDLEAAIGTITPHHQPPMQVRIDYMRGAGPSTIANIIVQFENRDLQFRAYDGLEELLVNLLERVSTMARLPVATFEAPLEIQVPPGMLEKAAQGPSIIQHSVSLAPGAYRLNIVAQDTVAGNLNNYEVALDVPRLDESKLASSSLVLGFTTQMLPAMSFSGVAMSAIGDTRVHPRLGNTFTSEEKLGIYLQVYNFRPDENTQKPLGSIEYEVDKAGSNERVMEFSEDVGQIPNASASQVTIEKILPLRTFQPGTYTLTVRATDKNGNQAVQRQGSFTVSQ